jgi:hypothetical protein
MVLSVWKVGYDIKERDSCMENFLSCSALQVVLVLVREGCFLERSESENVALRSSWHPLHSI